MSEVAVIGAGAWGTALAIQAARAERSVTLWARDRARARRIEELRQNPRLPGISLPASIRVTHELPRTDVALVAVPMTYLREVVTGLSTSALVACCKGLEPGTQRLPLEVFAALHPRVPAAVLTGPNFAHESAAGLPAAAVVAAIDPGLRRRVVEALATSTFRLYGNDDPIGAQLCGAAKNVIAIAAGAVAGAGLGENARAALITRGLAELSRLAAALGGRAETAVGLSGLGDLTLTCTGTASRNYTLGLEIGRGGCAADILAHRTTATEGAVAAPALIARAGDLDLPICRAVEALLAGRLMLDQAIAGVLARPLRDE
jgi:glycerol-3-phosphate dehydrogenase (NAD(P)+)